MTAGNQVWKDGKTPSDLWQIRGRLPWLSEAEVFSRLRAACWKYWFSPMGEFEILAGVYA
jgi:hypothetical protein